MLKLLLLCTLLCFVKHLHGLKVCSDCTKYYTCPKAVELAKKLKNLETEKKFKNSHCGFDFSGYQRIPKVCCSEFDDTPSLFDDIENHQNVQLLPDSCGDIDGKRILGGKIATLYEYPWMALISYKTRLGLRFDCGGSIINSRYILTAAHCVKNRNIAGVRIGEYDLSSKTDCQGEGEEYHCESHIQDILVEESIVHEHYEKLPVLINDIALLRLQKPINFSFKNAGPICLPISHGIRNVSLGGQTATVAGWGVTENDEGSSILLKVDIPILTTSDCRRKYNNINGIERQLCAGELNKDSCEGDSGGPLMLENIYKGAYRIIQYGIVSHGPRPCGLYNPGLYTDITKFMDWILNKIRQ